MKFLDVYLFVGYMYSEFQLLACPFCFFLSHSVAFAAWSGIQRVDPQMIHFELFYHLVDSSQFNPQTIFIFKKYILGIHPKKIIIPCPFHSKASLRLYKFETSWALLGRLIYISRGFFVISGPLMLNILSILNSFS